MKGQLTDFQSVASYQELRGVDGEPTEFEWNILPRCASLQIFTRSRLVCEARILSLKILEIGSSSCLLNVRLKTTIFVNPNEF